MTVDEARAAAEAASAASLDDDLDALIRAAKAEALEEAADAMPAVVVTGGWLRDRARRIREGA